MHDDGQIGMGVAMAIWTGSGEGTGGALVGDAPSSGGEELSDAVRILSVMAHQLFRIKPTIQRDKH